MDRCLKFARKFLSVFVDQTAGDLREEVPDADGLLGVTDEQKVFAGRLGVKRKVKLCVVGIVDVFLGRKCGAGNGEIVVFVPCIQRKAHGTDVIRPGRTANGQPVKRRTYGKTESCGFAFGNLQGFLFSGGVVHVAVGRCPALDSGGKCFCFCFGGDGRYGIGGIGAGWRTGVCLTCRQTKTAEQRQKQDFQ